MKHSRPTVPCGNPECGVPIRPTTAQHLILKAGRPIYCCNYCRYAHAKKNQPKAPPRVLPEVQCAHSGVMFVPSEHQYKRHQHGHPVFARHGYAKGYYAKLNPEPTEVTVRCPWETGSMPASMRATPIF